MNVVVGGFGGAGLVAGCVSGDAVVVVGRGGGVIVERAGRPAGRPVSQITPGHARDEQAGGHKPQRARPEFAIGTKPLLTSG